MIDAREEILAPAPHVGRRRAPKVAAARDVDWQARSYIEQHLV